MYLASVREDDSLMEKAASMGNARAMAETIRFSLSDDRTFQLACASAGKGDAKGTYCLMQCFWEGVGCATNESLAEELMDQAAALGSADAYYSIVQNRVSLEPAQKVKLLICFFGLFFYNVDILDPGLEAVLRRYATDGSYGEVIFEVGEAFKGHVDIEKGTVFGQKRDLVVLLRVMALYDGLLLPNEWNSTRMCAK